LVFFANILLKLHTAVVLRHLHKRLEVVEGRLVCRYYILHGSCWLDVLGALPGLYQAVRLLRVTSLLKQLYLEVSTGTLHHAVSRWMSGITLYAGLLMYAAALAVNFYACILVFIAEVAG
ncbi:cyclic nucleotide-binding domain-containing protein, partial [Haematococcus lacustris]